MIRNFFAADSRRRAIAAVSLGFAALIAAFAPSVRADGDACGPFGDPPAQVNHGYFASFVSAHNPICIGGKVVGPWNDPEGTARYACLYEPEPRPGIPLPLIVFFHGSLATADTIKLTGIPAMVGDTDLGGTRRGFILLAPEGRYTTHFYPGPDANALGWDNWYRQLNPDGDVTVGGTVYQENLDALAADHFVHDLIAGGTVDTNRIYAMGWSNGAAMAILYALNRPWLAAAAVYSAPSPFGAFNDPCAQKPVNSTPSNKSEIQVLNPRVPIMHVRNSCDIAGTCPNGSVLAKQMLDLKLDFQDMILDPSGMRVDACDDTCGTDPKGNGSVGASGSFRGFIHHVRWPPREWTDRMMVFLRDHPLAPSQK